MKTRSILKVALATVVGMAVALTACDEDTPTTLSGGTDTVPALVAVTGVTLSKTAVALHVGDTAMLTATVLPANATLKTVSWASTNPTVATVVNGLVTKIAEGTASIIVTTLDGTKTATCAVGTAVTGVTLNRAAAFLFAGDTLRLIPTVQPAGATNKAVAWASSNPLVATVSGGKVTAVAQGVATITVTTVDGSKTDICAVRVVPASWASSKFGTISFASAQTWTVGSQEWSDAVQATGCNKTSFNGNTADCRSNPGRKGDLFSWYAVNTYKSELCPSGWRVPTKDDFVALDLALGGTGNNGQSNTTLRNSYLSLWGGSYGGYCNSVGTLSTQGALAYYWSQSEDGTVYGFSLDFSSDGYVYPQYFNYKYYGLSLRCVR